ncbi:MAG: hypothetical protein JW747_05375 [Candidatus Aminicenantes bacterium]|nr:hypothetical protein [Candidatus Aminicenantes bacterium]
MAPPSPTPPRARDIAEELFALLKGADRRRTVFLDGAGEWAEDPVLLEDRIVHHVLFRLPDFAGGKRLTAAAVLAPVLAPEIRRALLSLSGGKTPVIEAAGLIRGLAVLLRKEVWKHNARRLVPDWRREETRRRRDDLARLAEEETRFRALLNQETRDRLEEILRGPEPAAEFFKTLVPLAAKEERLLSEIRDLRRELDDPERAEEAAGRLLEKIHPPLGIVTNTSPALLLPCLMLLNDESLNPDLGIPYAASVILSILRDPRSTAHLFRALRRFPPPCSKIRENVIYTLGGLRETSAVPEFVAMIDGPDEASEGDGRVRLLVGQKIEAVWALGRIGAEAMAAVPALARCAGHDSPDIKTCAAWALGEIGRAQKDKLGGLDADVVIALLTLLKLKDRRVYEETVGALRKIDLPEFVHSLYLYHAGAVSLQGLVPAQRGLYDLSETLHFLIRSKGRAIMAVTGDSGTGKTYFCQAIAGGFGTLRSGDILYLMRDDIRGRKVFNRILGLRWLKKHIDPVTYHDYPLSEEEDDPRSFLDGFLEANAHKKLIILDGCRDRDYFQRVIDTFYEQGALDLDVTFRATFSTRRLNLEERETALESVKTHLAFQEEPILEDTPFYREGVVLVYDLDNSVGARLDRDETLELFDRQKIESWGGFIRLGSFERGRREWPSVSSKLDLGVESISCRETAAPRAAAHPFRQHERHIRPLVNDNPEAAPNLLETFDLGDLSADRLRLYARNQVAGTAEDGRAFVLSFIDNRLFLAPGREEKAVGLALLGRDLAVLSEEGGLSLVSFEHDEITDLGERETTAPARSLGSSGRTTLASGHEDGSVMIRDLEEGMIRAFRFGRGAVRALACDLRGRVCAGTNDGWLFRLDPQSGRADVARFEGQSVTLVKTILRDKMLVVTEEPKAAAGAGRIHILDFGAGTLKTIGIEPGRRVTSVSADCDGRIVAGLDNGGRGAPFRPSLLIVAFEGERVFRSELSGHPRGTSDCLTMGPKIISCGREETGGTALRVWGAEHYVRTELGKLAVSTVWPSSLR